MRNLKDWTDADFSRLDANMRKLAKAWKEAPEGKKQQAVEAVLREIESETEKPQHRPTDS